MYHVHESHSMTDWENSIVTVSSTSRFGSIRECKNCGGEHVKTVAGESLSEELIKPCYYRSEK